MELIQNFKSNIDYLEHLALLPKEDYAALRLKFRNAASEAIAFTAIIIKERYDKKHKPI